MTNTPGDEPTRPEPPQEPTGGQPGYWEQQAQGQPPTAPYGQPPYSQAPPPGYPPTSPIRYAPDHPRAVTSLVLGILGVVLCQILAPFAWSTGKKTLDEIDASNGMVGGRGAAQAGYILGIVGTVLLAIYAVVAVGYLIFMLVVIGGGLAAS